MLELDDQQQAARDWFESLRDRICAEFEAIEDAAAATVAGGDGGRGEAPAAITLARSWFGAAEARC